MTAVNSIRFASIALAWLMTTAAAAAPYRPTSPDDVLLELGSGVQRVAVAHAGTQSKLARADTDAAVKMARDFIDLGRTQNDERYFGYASAVLQPWNTVAAAPVELAVLRADIAQHQHRFADAQKILDEVLVHDPANARATLMRAAILMTRGQPRLAQQDCQHLLALRETFVATLCIAQVASLTGRLATSYQLVSAVLQRSASDTSAQYAWGLGIAGEMAERNGDGAAAEQWLRKAMELSPTDLVSRLALCDVLLERKAYQQALTLLESAPTSEPVLLRRALASQHQDTHTANAALSAWQAAATQSAQLGIRLHLKELARGELELLNKPQQALATALQNWEIQREPADARILAQAARANGDKASLEKVARWQRDLHLEDARLLL